jgi:hypothetical protein
MDLGATRSANVFEMEKLFNKARTSLSDKTQRAMAVLNPILVTITNGDENKSDNMVLEVQILPPIHRWDRIPLN